MRGHLDYQAATWQLMPFTRCDGVYGLEGHAVKSGHIEHWLGGHARTIHHKGVCDWLQEVAGFPAARHQAEQRHVRRGHHIWTTKRQPGSPCTSPDVMLFMGPSKDMLCKVAMLNIGVEMVWRTRSHTSPWRLASRRRRLFSCAESSRAEARQARASGSPQGLEDTLAYVGKGVCGGLHEDVGFPAARHQAERRLVRPAI